MSMEDPAETPPNQFIERAKMLGVGAFAIAATLGGAALGAKFGYDIGEVISPDLDGSLGEVVEHGIEIVTAAGAAALGSAVALVTSVWIADGGLVDFMEGN